MKIGCFTITCKANCKFVGGVLFFDLRETPKVEILPTGEFQYYDKQTDALIPLPNAMASQRKPFNANWYALPNTCGSLYLQRNGETVEIETLGNPAGSFRTAVKKRRKATVNSLTSLTYQYQYDPTENITFDTLLDLPPNLLQTFKQAFEECCEFRDEKTRIKANFKRDYAEGYAAFIGDELPECGDVVALGFDDHQIIIYPCRSLELGRNIWGYGIVSEYPAFQAGEGIPIALAGIVAVRVNEQVPAQTELFVSNPPSSAATSVESQHYLGITVAPVNEEPDKMYVAIGRPRGRRSKVASNLWGDACKISAAALLCLFLAITAICYISAESPFYYDICMDENSTNVDKQAKNDFFGTVAYNGEWTENGRVYMRPEIKKIDNDFIYFDIHAYTCSIVLGKSASIAKVWVTQNGTSKLANPVAEGHNSCGLSGWIDPTGRQARICKDKVWKLPENFSGNLVTNVSFVFGDRCYSRFLDMIGIGEPHGKCNYVSV